MATNYAGIAEAFRRARGLIAVGTSRRICFALGHTEHPEMDSAKALIEDRMEGSAFLEDWVQFNVLECERYPTDAEMREYRLRWLDALIEEFEGYAKEDSTND